MNRCGGGVAPCPCGVEATKQTAQRARCWGRELPRGWFNCVGGIMAPV